MAGIGIIANPHSKLNKRNPKRQQLLSYIAGEKGRVEVTNDLNHLSRVAKDFKSRKIEILAINGGDGTISRTLTAFSKAYGGEKLPYVSLLRGGTMNMLAENLGIYGTPEQNLYRLIESHSQENEPSFSFVDLRTLKIDNKLGFLFADGLSANFLEEFYKNKSGIVGSIWLFLKIVASAPINGSLYRRLVKSEKKSICYDGSHYFFHEAISTLCSTVEKIPLKFRLVSKAKRFEARF